MISTKIPGENRERMTRDFLEYNKKGVTYAGKMD